MRRYLGIYSLYGMILLFLLLAQAPSFNLLDLDKDEVFLDSLLTKGPVVLSFWATWCKPCLKELDAFNELELEFDSVTFVAINEDGPRTQKKVPSFVKSRGWDSLLILIDSNRKAIELFQVEAIPHTFIIDTERNILYHHIGYRKGDEETVREKLLAISAESSSGEAKD